MVNEPVFPVYVQLNCIRVSLTSCQCSPSLPPSRLALPPSALKYAIVHLCECSEETFQSIDCISAPQCLPSDRAVHASLCSCLPLWERPHWSEHWSEGPLCWRGGSGNPHLHCGVCLCVCWQTFGFWMLFHSVQLKLWSPHCGSQHSFIGVYYSFYYSNLVFRINLI